jgi:natural product biosynthesis luciferase-like monooxygenase protein
MKTIEEQKAYWLKRLEGPPVAVTLPPDRERPPVSSYLRETTSLALDADLWGRLKEFAAGRAASPQVVLLAALNAVLHRYTGSTDIPVAAMLDGAGGAGPRRLVVLRTGLAGDLSGAELLRQMFATVAEASANGGCPVDAVLEALGRESGEPQAPLFHVAVLYSGAGAADEGGGSEHAAELARCDLVVRFREDPAGLSLSCEYDTELFDASTIERFARHLSILLGGIMADPAAGVGSLPLLTEAELRQLLVGWNDTKTPFPADVCIHQLFEAQVERTPDAVAAVFRDRQLTYRQLNARANQLGHRLRKLGVGPDTLVGICVERSLEMLVGLLGILKAGGAYVPLDPNYPRERLAFMMEDSRVEVLLTQRKTVGRLPGHSARVLELDPAGSEFADEPQTNPAGGVTAGNLAYVIYTSGSTGRPKGVMICHRNVSNFFTGMDLSSDGRVPGVWLAVTSISFDISVLELFWTLARGFKVIIYGDENRGAGGAGADVGGRAKKMDFSLFYFASDAGQDAGNRYRLLLEGARFADQHGFEAVWTPERHFHAFGGLYPNPSVTSAAVAAVTERISIRAGSVVLPLQNPIRVAEEWSVVDNLSRGRVAVSFASGWQVNDFVLAPHNYSGRKEVMLREIETVRKLWRGETLAIPGVDGKEVPVKILPRPVQPELPIWLTATGNPETYRMAGESGANLLTHLVGQKIEELAQKILIYRQARRERGHAGEGRITLMLHTFVGDDLQAVRETVRKPFSDYLRSSVDLLKNSPWGFAPARLSPDSQGRKLSTGPANLTEDELSALLEHAFEGYFESGSLFGTPDVCLRMVEKIRAIGVDEIACLIDFGVDSQKVLDSLGLLDEVRRRSNAGADAAGDDYSLAALARRHGVTHFQCTPSMAAMLLGQPGNRELFGSLRRLMIGGEAFPAAVAKQLKALVPGSIHNMYGPTETTVWSATQMLGQVESVVPIGRPIANTEIYLLNERSQPVPAGLPGELCIGGAGVVRGYWNRPELTEEKFVRNPFSPDPQSRLYRTGDLARYRPDGSIEFLGRIDHQVKVRGHRIELAEVESVLGQHGSVRESVVVVREDAPGDKRLVAYVVLQPGTQAEARGLRAFAQEKLPDYMVPSTVVFLDRLPQTPNGKIDRRALPAPGEAPAAESAQFLAPRTPVEEVLAQIWADLLGCGRVGAEDNFFELGGHSLLATQMVTRLREVFRLELPLGILFQAPTVSGLAAYLTAHEPKPGLIEKMALIWKRIEGMSESQISEGLKSGRAG